MRPEDTSPEAWEILLNIYRRMTPDEKLQRAFEMSDFLRSMCEARIRADHPAASEREVFLRLTRHIIGPELFQRAYGALIPQ
jgi:Rv0078B-related antitoxin